VINVKGKSNSVKGSAWGNNEFKTVVMDALKSNIKSSFVIM
jgi:hypothetical protein